MDWGAMGGFMWVTMFIWVILGIALIVLAVTGVVWLARRAGRTDRSRPRYADRTAVEELKLRYARGEVDRDTYRAIREDLERDGA